MPLALLILMTAIFFGAPASLMASAPRAPTSRAEALSSRAEAPSLASAEAPRVAGSYIVAWRTAGAAGLATDGVADSAAFQQAATSAFAFLPLTKPPRFLATLPLTEAATHLRSEQGAGEQAALLRLDFPHDDGPEGGAGPERAAIAQLEKMVADGIIAYYEPNYLSKPYSDATTGTFGDVLPRYLDYLNADCGGDGTECHLRYQQLQLVKAFQAMPSTPLDDAPVIAVMDSGVDFQHPALEGKLWQNNAEQQGISGCEGDIYGCDTTQSTENALGLGATIFPTGTAGAGETCPPLSEQGGNCIHGTHIAGIIAATTAPINGYAFPGVCPSCKVLSVKIVGPTRDGGNSGEYSIADSSIIAGLSYIENFSRKVKPVKVVNASFGKFHSSRSVEAMLRRVQKNGTLFVAATGNESTEKPSYPAAFDGVIAVANISKRTRAKHENSNFGTWVDISAPGSGFSGIASTKPGGNYIPLIGTSMAAPMVAAVAGLVWAKEPGLSANEVASRILDGADGSMYDVAENQAYLLSSGSMRQPLLGRGSLNAFNAVTGTKANSLSPMTRDLPAACGTIRGHAHEDGRWWWLLYLLPGFAMLGFNFRPQI